MSKEVKRFYAPDYETEYANGKRGQILAVAASDYDVLLAEVASLMKWKQTAEYWYGQYRFVKHGESPAEYPPEGKLDDWHKSYHTT